VTKRATLLSTAVAVTACGVVYEPARLRSALDARDLEQARSMLDTSLTRRHSAGTKQSGRDTGRLLLERGSVHPVSMK
jgi:hypothetical protein